MWVTRRKDKRQSPGAAVLSRVRQRRLDVLVFAGPQAKSSDRSAVNGVGIEWVGLDVAVFAASLDGTPVVRVQRRIQTPAGRGGGAAVLLRAVDPVRKTAVGDDVVELARGLVVPRTPRLAAAHGDDGALIAAENHALRFIGINPQEMIIVAAVEPAFPGVHDQINPLRV